MAVPAFFVTLSRFRLHPGVHVETPARRLSSGRNCRNRPGAATACGCSRAAHRQDDLRPRRADWTGAAECPIQPRRGESLLHPARRHRRARRALVRGYRQRQESRAGLGEQAGEPGAAVRSPERAREGAPDALLGRAVLLGARFQAHSLRRSRSVLAVPSRYGHRGADYVFTRPLRRSPLLARRLAPRFHSQAQPLRGRPRGRRPAPAHA